VRCSEPTWEIMWVKTASVVFPWQSFRPPDDVTISEATRRCDYQWGHQTMWLSVRPPDDVTISQTTRPLGCQTVSPSAIRPPDHWSIRPQTRRTMTIYSSDLQTIGPTYSQTTIPSNGQPLSYHLPYVTHPTHLSGPDSLPTNGQSEISLSESV